MNREQTDKTFVTDEEYERVMIKQKVNDCRGGEISAFVVLKDVPFKTLESNFRVTREEFEKWQNAYNESANLII